MLDGGTRLWRQSRGIGCVSQVILPFSALLRVVCHSVSLRVITEPRTTVFVQQG